MSWKKDIDKIAAARGKSSGYFEEKGFFGNKKYVLYGEHGKEVWRVKDGKAERVK